MESLVLFLKLPFLARVAERNIGPVFRMNTRTPIESPLTEPSKEPLEGTLQRNRPHQEPEVNLIIPGCLWISLFADFFPFLLAMAQGAWAAMICGIGFRAFGLRVWGLWAFQSSGFYGLGLSILHKGLVIWSAIPCVVFFCNSVSLGLQLPK